MTEPTHVSAARGSGFALPAFPAADASSGASSGASSATLALPLSLTPARDGSAITLCDATPAHLPWLQALYRQSRWNEVALAGWPEAAGTTFLDQQFALQHAHYVVHFARARFWIVLRDGAPCGRLYADLSPTRHHLIDVLLEASCRGSGVGSMLLHALQTSATRHGCPLELSVLHDNHGAQRLYRRLGFEDISDSATHRLMRWTPVIS